MSMKAIGNLIFSCAVLSGLTGCASNDFSLAQWFSPAEEQQAEPEVKEVMVEQPDAGVVYRAEAKARAQQMAQQPKDSQVILYRRSTKRFQPAYSHKSLADYAEQLTMELVKNGQQLNTQSRVGIASFVNLDHALQHAGALGNQLSELLIAEVQSFGVPVIDFKTTGAILVGEKGDMVFSRNANRLANTLAVDFVLSGTLIRNDKGVRVNARIVDMQSKVVVSTATLIIPHFVVDSLQSNYVVVGE